MEHLEPKLTTSPFCNGCLLVEFARGNGPLWGRQEGVTLMCSDLLRFPPICFQNKSGKALSADLMWPELGPFFVPACPQLMVINGH